MTDGNSEVEIGSAAPNELSALPDLYPFLNREG